MNDFLETLSDFIGGIIATAILSGSILLMAGEIRLEALKKVKNGSVRLFSFTERMTQTRLPLHR
jgi:hypothetical protein